MSWLDNVVAWISPEAGAKRAAWRATYNELRNYDAGNNSRLFQSTFPRGERLQIFTNILCFFMQ